MKWLTALVLLAAPALAENSVVLEGYQFRLLWPATGALSPDLIAEQAGQEVPHLFCGEAAFSNGESWRDLGAPFRGLLLVMRAKVLVSLTVDRLDKERCVETLPPVLAYLDRADRALEQAEALEQDLPPLYEVRRRVHLRRSKATEACPVEF